MQGSFATSAVPGTRFTEIRWVTETGSTNADLLAAAAEGAAEGLVLVADHQSAGRGRLDRTWVAPPGSSLLVSVLLRPQLAPEALFLITAAAGVASVEAVAEVAGVACGLKWPNDLVATGAPAADRKLSGVLAESVLSDGGVEALVVGMGLNVNWPAELPAELASTATALNHLAGGEVDREALLVSWLQSLDRWLTMIGDGTDPAGRTALFDAMRGRSATLGRQVRVELAGSEILGEAVGLDELGRLAVSVDGLADPIEVAVGDVVHLRPVD
jgi:BirA family biotin operon repressor/biotin-[acetyl-CoA-carboxylase] ligase